METQAVVALVIGVVVVLFAPALVWSAVISGLYQIVQDKVRGMLQTVTKTTVEAE
jgi:hypothetical protein